MPLLTLVPRSACEHCGCRLRGFTVGTYRINKNSLKSDHGGLSWLECPECGPTFAKRNPTGVMHRCDVWRLDPDSQAVVDRYRTRKGWTTTNSEEPTA